MTGDTSKIRNHPRLRKYTSLIQRDLSAIYSRDLHQWLIFGPLIGVITGLVITLIVKVVLDWMWPGILRYYIAHPLEMFPGLLAGFVIAGLIMQYLTPDPDNHSTEEVIRSYHEHQGDIQMRPFVPKLLASIATVGLGGSAALEGPGIYSGGALGSWLWTRLRAFHAEPSNRRIMLISGAAAGMAAVFRAPLTGVIFALEMPYKDDLAHEALLPSLLASVVSYATLASFLGPGPLFDFAPGSGFSGKDLMWSALLGLICGLVVLVFDVVFRRVRSFFIGVPIPHWLKMAIGGVLTAVCGVAFLSMFRGPLVPIGPNYEAVPGILTHAHPTIELVAFSAFKMLATIFSLGAGGVSALFVPLFVTGESIGVAFAQSVVHSSSIDLYAAVGMAAFLAGGYKAPFTAVVFVAEATGGHSYIISALVGAAVAYAVSGEASVSGDQRLHESVRVARLAGISVREVMQTQVLSVDASSTLREFSDSVSAHYLHAAYPVFRGQEVAGVIAIRSLARVPVEKWSHTTVGNLADPHTKRVSAECDVMEALRLLTARRGQHMLLVTSASGKLEGILTQADILYALQSQRGKGGSLSDQP